MERVFTDFHLFCGAGGGALGFSWATRTYGSLRGRFRSLGGVDSHPRRAYAEKVLLEAGAPARREDEDGRAYVRRALAEGPFRAVWHPGNHAYVWPLDRAAAAAAAPALPYPKGVAA